MKVIASLRTDLDNINEQYENKVQQINDLTAELRAVKDVSEHRAIDVERLRSELKQSYEAMQRLREDYQQGQDHLRRHREEK